MPADLLLAPRTDADRLVERLETDGLVRLPSLVSAATLADMQRAFASRLGQMRWNNCDGYERGERYRYMVQDVLTLAQGFVDIALHPLVQAVARAYVGPGVALCEAKGWRSLPTTRDFNGWHGDAWYDQDRADGIPREIKLGFYLTDVRGGAFQYIKGSHGKEHPRILVRPEAAELPLDRMEEVLGPAGSAFLFDTSGIHRQGVPIPEPRQACFLNYHDPAVPLQQEDVDYYRYHPLLLNAAFLGNLSAEDYRVLGFGDKTHHQPHFARRGGHRWFQACVETAFSAKLVWHDWSGRVFGKLGRLLRGKR